MKDLTRRNECLDLKGKHQNIRMPWIQRVGLDAYQHFFILGDSFVLIISMCVFRWEAGLQSMRVSGGDFEEGPV